MRALEKIARIRLSPYAPPICPLWGAKAMKILLLAVLNCVVVMAADNTESVPRETDVVALVACASHGSIAGDLTRLSGRNGTYTYSATFSRLPDGRPVTAVMLFSNARALLLEGTISRTKVGIVNVAAFRRTGSEWTLEETHAGAEVAAHVGRIGYRLAEKKHKVMKVPTSSGDRRACVGIGIR